MKFPVLTASKRVQYGRKKSSKKPPTNRPNGCYAVELTPCAATPVAALVDLRGSSVSAAVVPPAVARAAAVVETIAAQTRNKIDIHYHQSPEFKFRFVFFCLRMLRFSALC